MYITLRADSSSPADSLNTLWCWAPWAPPTGYIHTVNQCITLTVFRLHSIIFFCFLLILLTFVLPKGCQKIYLIDVQTDRQMKRNQVNYIQLTEPSLFWCLSHLQSVWRLLWTNGTTGTWMWRTEHTGGDMRRDAHPTTPPASCFGKSCASSSLSSCLTA